MMSFTDSSIAKLVLQTLICLGIIFAVSSANIALIHIIKGPKSNPAQKSKINSLWLRSLTYFIIAPILLVPTFFGKWVFLGLIMLIIILASFEFWRLLESCSRPVYKVLGVLFSLSVPLSAAIFGVQAMVYWGLGFGLILIPSFVIPAGQRVWKKIGDTVLGVLYIAFLLAFLLLLGMDRGGLGKVVFFLFVVQLADVGAMQGGLLFGKTPLAPLISPGKTWEGFGCGVLAAIGTAMLFQFTIPDCTAVETVALAVLLAISGLLGDLLASALKRRGGFRDFGGILPGHGGIMDRVDSSLVAAPSAWIYFQNHYLPFGVWNPVIAIIMIILWCGFVYFIIQQSMRNVKGSEKTEPLKYLNQ